LKVEIIIYCSVVVGHFMFVCSANHFPVLSLRGQIRNSVIGFIFL
jgi:hypothetical protein